jgi:benzaldehyde dehydrogenase (NAD)
VFRAFCASLRGLTPEFTRRLTENASRLTVGDPGRGGVAIGPLISLGQIEHASSIISASCAAGATVLTGGINNGLYLEPTVLTDVTRENPAFSSEIFAPVAVLATFETDEDAITLANDTDYGLSAAIISQSVGRALALGDRLDVGLLHINDATVNDEVINPFGGVGKSGNRSSIGGPANWEEFTQWQWVTVRSEPPAYPL